MQPRGRLHQDDTFEVAGLAGGIVEKLLGYTTEAERDDQPEKMFLKVHGLPWQSYFLDAGLGFWEESGEEEDPFDAYRGDSREIDYGERFGLLGARIIEARCSVIEPWQTTSIAVTFEAGVLRLSYARPNDLDADVVLTFERFGG